MLLALLFFLIALFYAGAGLGGGSSYLALLVLWDVKYQIIPVLALLCNIIVVSGNSFHYVRAGYLNLALLSPLILSSLPFAYLGGRIHIEKEPFLILLFITLLIAGGRLLLNYRSYQDQSEHYQPIPVWLSCFIGSLLGFLAGSIGIGGGIFLAPILYNMRAAPPKQIATTTSLFILINSIAGLTGQLQKTGMIETITEYYYLPFFVLIGGQIGNMLTLKLISSRSLALLTSCLVLLVAGRLGLILIGY